MTPGALTTFSIANDLAKYFCDRAGHVRLHPPMAEIVRHHAPAFADLGHPLGGDFQCLIIPALIPIALKGVTYRPVGADALLRKNLLIWGLGGVIVPFIGIKVIDLAMVVLTSCV